MWLEIRVKTKFRELHFRRRGTLHKIGEFYLSDHGWQPQFGQNSILARSKAKIRNWKIINCFVIYIYVSNPFHWQKMKEIILGRKSSGPLLAGLPLKVWIKCFFVNLFLICFFVFLLPLWNELVKLSEHEI